MPMSKKKIHRETGRQDYSLYSLASEVALILTAFLHLSDLISNDAGTMSARYPLKFPASLGVMKPCGPVGGAAT